MAATGIACSDEVIAQFNEVKLGRTKARFIIYKIEGIFFPSSLRISNPKLITSNLKKKIIFAFIYISHHLSLPRYFKDPTLWPRLWGKKEVLTSLWGCSLPMIADTLYTTWISPQTTDVLATSLFRSHGKRDLRKITLPHPAENLFFVLPIFKNEKWTSNHTTHFSHVHFIHK